MSSLLSQQLLDNSKSLPSLTFCSSSQSDSRSLSGWVILLRFLCGSLISSSSERSLSLTMTDVCVICWLVDEMGSWLHVYHFGTMATSSLLHLESSSMCGYCICCSRQWCQMKHWNQLLLRWRITLFSSG